MCLMPGIAAYAVAVGRGYPAEAFPGWSALPYAFAASIPGLFTAVIVVGGVLSGITTVTGAFGAIYAVLVTIFVYRALDMGRAAQGRRRRVPLRQAVAGRSLRHQRPSRHETEPKSMKTYPNHITGEQVADGPAFRNDVTGGEVSAFATGTLALVDRAANAAFRPYSRTTRAERAPCHAPTCA